MLDTFRSSSASKPLAILLLLGGVLLFGFYAGHASAAAPAHPAPTPAPVKGPAHLEKAIDFLNKAKAELEAADPDRGGNRTEALRLVTDATIHVEKALRFQDQH
ncbi:MAG TPA: hypothetical protein VGK45_12205 [Thermoanaerobaculia bacterium]